MILKKQRNIELYSIKYFENLSQIFKKIDIKKLSKLATIFEKCRKQNAKIFVIGNGGSAVNASAMVNDLGFDILKKTKKKSFNIISLSDNNAVSTAISNDIGYENIFLSQIQMNYKKNDVIIVMSVSGNSKNLIKACNWVKKNNGYVFGILGCGGGKLKKICNESLIIPSKKGEYGPVEDLQLIINHILAHWYQITLK